MLLNFVIILFFISCNKSNIKETPKQNKIAKTSDKLENSNLTETSKTILIGNRWGFMYSNNFIKEKDYGELGKHLLKSKKGDSIPYLKKLLNDSSLLLYEGSKEATVGNMLKYRVKDAAAFYIGEILNIKIKYKQRYSDRDKEINKLIKEMNLKVNLKNKKIIELTGSF